MHFLLLNYLATIYALSVKTLCNFLPGQQALKEMLHLFHGLKQIFAFTFMTLEEISICLQRPWMRFPLILWSLGKLSFKYTNVGVITELLNSSQNWIIIIIELIDCCHKNFDFKLVEMKPPTLKLGKFDFKKDFTFPQKILQK